MFPELPESGRDFHWSWRVPIHYSFRLFLYLLLQVWDCSTGFCWFCFVCLLVLFTNLFLPFFFPLPVFILGTFWYSLLQLTEFPLEIITFPNTICWKVSFLQCFHGVLDNNQGGIYSVYFYAFSSFSCLYVCLWLKWYWSWVSLRCLLKQTSELSQVLLLSIHLFFLGLLIFLSVLVILFNIL